MNFPITLDKIRAYEKEIASGIEERIYNRIKPYMKTEPTRIYNELQEKIERNVRGKSMSNTYTVTIGNYETVLREFTIQDIESVVKKRFTDGLLEYFFPGAEVRFLNNPGYTIALVWTIRPEA